MGKAAIFVITGVTAFFLSQEWGADILFFAARETASIFGATLSVSSWSICFAILAVAAALAIAIRVVIARQRRVLGFGVLVVACLGVLLVVNREHPEPFASGTTSLSTAVTISYSASWLLTLLLAEIGASALLRVIAQKVFNGP